MGINVGGTISLFECLRALAVRSLWLWSRAQARNTVPLPNWTCPFARVRALSPLHPYGVSKVAAGLARRAVFHELRDPGDSPSHLQYHWTGKTGRRLFRPHEARRRDRDGNLSAVTCRRQSAKSSLANRRSRSRSEGFWLAAEHCRAGEVYNIGGDDVYSVEQLVDMIRAQVKFENFQVEQRPELMRSCDELVIAGDNAKFRNCCGWQPAIPLAATLRDMLAWWRVRLAAAVPQLPRQESAGLQNFSV